jgi:polyribonucleotide nucleotidyltransferase
MENKFKLKLGGRELTIEVNTFAEQANGSVVVRYGDTVVLGTAVMSKQEREGIDFFPLYVDYEEKFYAAGKILGARYIRREGRPTDEAILTARLIDRTIRPLFPKGLKREVQVIITCLCWDKENDPDILGLIAASCALSLSDIPWNGPVAAIRIGKRKEKFILNPTYAERGNLLNLSEHLNQPSEQEQSEQSDMDLVLAGVGPDASLNPKSSDILINMIEAECAEAQEDTILKATQFANPELKKILDFQKKIKQEAGKEKVVISEPAPEPELERIFRR